MVESERTAEVTWKQRAEGELKGARRTEGKRSQER